MTRGFGFTGRQPTAVTAAAVSPTWKAVERGLLQTSARDGQPRRVKIAHAGGVAAGDLGLFVVRHPSQDLPRSGRSRLGSADLNDGSCPLRDLADGLGSAATAENRFRPTTGYAAARVANNVKAEGTEARAVSIAAARCPGPRARPSALLAADRDRPLINLVGAIRGSRERGVRSTPPRGRIHRRTRCRRRVPATGAPFRRSCEHPPRRECASDRP